MIRFFKIHLSASGLDSFLVIEHFTYQTKNLFIIYSTSYRDIWPSKFHIYLTTFPGQKSSCIDLINAAQCSTCKDADMLLLEQIDLLESQHFTPPSPKKITSSSLLTGEIYLFLPHLITLFP